MAFANGGRIVTDGLVISLDAADRNSYPGSGTVWRDMSGRGNNATLVNSPTFNTSNGGVIVLDGTDDTISTEVSITTLAALSNFSMDCWMSIPSYPTAAPPNAYSSTTKQGVVIGATYYSGTALFWTGNGTGTSFSVFGYIRGADAYRSTSAYSITSLNTYFNFTIVNNYTASTFALYVNGVLYSSVAGPTQEYNPSLIPTAGNIGLSKSQVDGGGTQNYTPLACNIASAKIYAGKALSTAEVLQNYNAQKSRFNL